MYLQKILLLILINTSVFCQSSILQLWQKGNREAKFSHEEALKFYKSAFQVAKLQNNFIWQSNILTDISGAYFGLGDYKSGIESCKLGLQILVNKKIKIDSIQFKLYSAIAANYKSAYQISSAQLNYKLANEFLEKRPGLEKEIPLYVAYHFSNQGALWLMLCDNISAKMYFEKALLIAKKLPDSRSYALILSNLSKIHNFNETYSEGIILLEDAVKIYTNNKNYNKIELSKMYFSLGDFYKKNGEINKSQFNFEKCSNLNNENPNSLENGYIKYIALFELANLEISRKNFSNAAKILEKCRKIDMEEELKYDYWVVYGNYYFQKRDFTKANEFYSKAKNFISQKNVTYLQKEVKLFEIQKKLGECNFLLFQQEGGQRYLKLNLYHLNACISLGKRIRQNFSQLESKSFFTNKFYIIYKQATRANYLLYRISKDKNYVKNAFYLAEEAKSVFLTDLKLFDSVIRNKKQDSLFVKLNTYQNYLSFIKNTENKNLAAINEFELKVNKTIEQIKANNKFFEEYSNSNNAISFPKIHSYLPSNTIYLNYILLENELYIIGIDHFKSYLKKIPFNRIEFDNHLKNLASAISKPPEPFEGFSGKTGCAYFYDLFISKLGIDFSNYKRLLVNPSNEFYSISFDILLNNKTDKFLIEDLAITYTNNLLSGLLDKTSKKVDNSWNIFLPIETSHGLENGLKPLPYSFEEVKGIRSTIFKGKEASKLAFLNLLQQDSVKVLLIATHGSNNGKDPSLDFNGANTAESKLYASELQYIKVKSPMVILSGCQTNNGKKIDGLGILSISKSLEIAGCSSVAGSFWEVDDKSMSVLASLFYKNLMKGLDKDIALQKAKIEYLHTEIGKKNDSPFYWAHFQIFGNNQPLVNKIDFNNLFLIVVLTLLLAFVIIYFNSKKLF